MSIIVRQLAYTHPNREILFEQVSFSIATGEKVSLTGNNGSGKSTLLQILAGRLEASAGEVICPSKPFYVPQHFGQSPGQTVAEALGIAPKIEALHRILSGDASIDFFNTLDDDWEVEERSLEALGKWDLPIRDLAYPMQNLSGGEKTRVLLSGIAIHEPDIILLDEPTNHLDGRGRKQLYDLIDNLRATLLTVSHDRKLLNLLSTTYELKRNGMERYGGNYEFYKTEKEKQLQTLQEDLAEREKEFRKAKKLARETMEKQLKHESRGKKNNLKKGIPRILMGNLKDKAEVTRSKLKDVHNEKVEDIQDNLLELRGKVGEIRQLKTDFGDAQLHSGKVLADAKGINFTYGNGLLWRDDLTFRIQSGERIAIRGDNGSGKTTLLRLITGEIEAARGSIARSEFRSIYIDQEYSILDSGLTVYEQICKFNSRALLEHELKIILNRFLFPKESWDKRVGCLSGGEKMRLLLACLQTGNNQPEVFILDEPTNNLDISSLEILTATLKDFRGTILMVSHDDYFLKETGMEREIELKIENGELHTPGVEGSM